MTKTFLIVMTIILYMLSFRKAIWKDLIRIIISVKNFPSCKTNLLIIVK
jgi:hypothetical protein